ncbi:hypothetical protein JCM5350_005154 [Sporobolomyces pararoseus]
MEERRVFKPPLSSRSASGQGSNSKSSRLPKPSSTSSSSSSRPVISRPISQTRPQISSSSSSRVSSSSSSLIAVKQSFVPPSTSLPYLDHHSSRPANQLTTTTTPTSFSSRRNLSISNLQAQSRSRQTPLDPLPRPHSFPPPSVPVTLLPSTIISGSMTTVSPAAVSIISSRRLPPKVSRDPSNASLDPFKVHANRVLRPSATCSTLTGTARNSVTSSSLLLPPRSSSLTSSYPSSRATTTTTRKTIDDDESPRRRSHHQPQQPSQSPHSLLKRTTTVRSATSSSSSYSISSTRRSRGGKGNGNGRRKPSISGTESFIMKISRTNSSQGVGGGKGREGRVLMMMEEQRDEDEGGNNLVGDWKAFVGVGEEEEGFETISSPLIDQLPPPTSSSPFTSSSGTFSPSPESGGQESNSFPLTSFRNSSSSQSRRRLSQQRHVRSRSSKILSISSTPRELSQTLPQLNHYLHTRGGVGGEGGEAPSPTLSRSTFGTGTGTEMTRVDSEVLLTRLTLKRLGSRGFEGDALDKLGRNREEGEGIVEHERDAVVEDWADRYRDSYDPSSSGAVGMDEEEGLLKTISPSSSTSSSIGLPGSSSCSISTMSSSTSIGTLSMSRNWSKSSLMEELEKELVGRLSRDFESEQRGSYSEQGEEEEYVCALDLIWEDSETSLSSSSSSEGEEEEAEEVTKEIPVRRGGGPLLVPPPSTTCIGISRLPRLKPSSGNLNATSTSLPLVPPPVPNLPKGFVSKLAQPVSVANKFTRVGVGRGTTTSRARAGWV